LIVHVVTVLHCNIWNVGLPICVPNVSMKNWTQSFSYPPFQPLLLNQFYISYYKFLILGNRTSFDKWSIMQFCVAWKVS